MSSGWAQNIPPGAILTGTVNDTRVFTEEKTLTLTDIANGYIPLSRTPFAPNETRLNVFGGPPQDSNVDFIVIQVLGQWRLSWASLTLQSLLTVGDVLQFSYPVVEATY